jgi:hypothetical protein
MRRKITEHRFAIIALLVWVVLLAAAAWLNSFKTIAGSTTGSMTSALAGSFGSVVLGTFGLESWLARQRRERERIWVATNAELLSATMSSGSRYLAEIASSTYSLVEPFLDERERVPERYLVDDVERQPRRDGSGLSAEQNKTRRRRMYGPLVAAHSQARSLANEARARYDGLLKLLDPFQAEGDTDPPPQLPAPPEPVDAELLDESWHRLDEVAGRVERAAEGVAELMRDMSTEGLYLPLQKELAVDEEESQTLGMLTRARQLQRAVYELVIQMHPKPAIEEPGAGDLAGHAEDEKSVIALLEAAEDVLHAIDPVRRGLWRHAEIVVKRAEELPDAASLIELVKEAVDSLSKTRADALDVLWELWLQDALRVPGHRLQVLRP